MILAAISARLSHFSMQAIVSALALLAVYATGLKILPAKPLTRSNRVRLRLRVPLQMLIPCAQLVPTYSRGWYRDTCALLL